MKITFDPTADAIRIKFQEGNYELSKELDDGIILDLTKDNKIMAIEILDVSERMPRKTLEHLRQDARRRSRWQSTRP